MIIFVFGYAIPPIEGQGWGIFLLDSTGMFTCVTDYGNYAYKWTDHGMDDFRKFVIQIDWHYTMEKLWDGRSKEFDGKQTVQAIERHIIEYRREGYYTKEFARKEWDLLQEQHSSYFSHEHDFMLWYEETELQDASEFAVYDYPATVKALVIKLLPRLQEEIRQELAREAA